MQWLADPLQTVAGGANRPESLSRSPTLQLRGECRPLLVSDGTASKEHLQEKTLLTSKVTFFGDM